MSPPTSSENDSHFPIFLVHPIHSDLFLGGSGLELTGRHVELRTVPQTLNRAAYHHPACQRTSPVRTAVVERDVTVLVARAFPELSGGTV